MSRSASTDPRPSWRRLRRLLPAVSMAVIWTVAGVSDLSPASLKPGEYEVKAAYLYNFGKFIRWPDGAGKDDSFPICVLGHDPFGAILDSTLAGESIGGKRATAMRLARAQDADGCRILFISSSENKRLGEDLVAVGNATVLTVSDIPQFCQRGGMIQFVLQGDRVRFEVNLAAAQHAGLSLSSELLKVATTVRTVPVRERE
jgi:hypothetical protein